MVSLPEISGGLISLEKKYRKSIQDYYRNVLRKQDDIRLKTILKIPDNWEEFDKKKKGLDITEENKKQLTNKKKLFSQQLQFESLYLDNLVTIENAMISCLNFRELSDDDIEEAKESVTTLLEDIDKNINSFKDLLLILAKRAVSDLYYLIAAYLKYYKKANFSFESDFKEFCRVLTGFFDEYKFIGTQLETFIKKNKGLNEFISMGSKSMGYRLNEPALMKFLKRDKEEVYVYFLELKKILSSAYLFKKKLKLDHEFIIFYFNENDGKLFRYEYIANTLSQKYKDEQIPSSMMDGFNSILQNFTLLKKAQELRGLPDFGPARMTYFELVNFLYKGSRVLESYYLQTSHYDELNNFRNSLLHFVENEYYQLNPEVTRL